MKKVIAILISCSLALAASVIAQQDEQQQKQKKEKAPPAKSQPVKSQPANEAKPAPKPQAVPRQHTETNAPEREINAAKPQTGEPTYKPHAATKVPGREPGHANANREQTEQPNKEGSATNESENANKPPGPAPANEREQYNRAGGAPQPNTPNPPANKLNAQANKPDPQTLQKIKTQHAN